MSRRRRQFPVPPAGPLCGAANIARGPFRRKAALAVAIVEIEPMPSSKEIVMEHRIVIEGGDGAFEAYIARPAKLPAPAVVVLQELFGVNADIRKHCDNLAEIGFLAVAPDLFWREEPGVDLDVRSEADWQHGLRLYQAFDRDEGVRDIETTVRATAELPECNGKVALLGYCLGALMAFMTAARSDVQAVVWYHGGDTEKYLAEAAGLNAPMLMHLAEEDEFISKAAQAEIKAAMAGKPNVAVYSYPGQSHAFSRNNGAHYDAAAAALANGRTHDFLNRELGDPSVRMEQDMSRSQVARTVAVEHRALVCRRTFEEVRLALTSRAPALKPEVSEMLVKADTQAIAHARAEWPKLWTFLERDHGALTAADGLRSKAIQYEIGNPLTAERMTRHALAAGLYAPLRVILYEDAEGAAVFEYDLPSTLFGQFGDPRVAEVGRELDAELEGVLDEAAGWA